MSIDLLQELKKNPFVLAPMAGITDRPFRSFMREMGCGAVITELVSATGLKFSSEKTKRLMQFDESQHPVGIQIFGDSLEDIAFAAKAVQDMGADFVDLNFGCPVPKVVKKGGGAAILKDLSRVTEVFKTIRGAVDIPVTVKVRTGWDADSRNSIELANIAYNEGLSWVGIHGRTRAQAYAGKADWDYIKEVKAGSKIPILGNGDLVTPELAVDRLLSSGCDGVMIGRGCLKNPWIFLQSLSLLNKHQQKIEGFDFVFDRLKYHLERHCEERIVTLQIKKLSSWFSSGYPGSSQFRKDVFQTKEKNELYERVGEYFAGLSPMGRADTSGENFLMGGHG